MASTHRTIKYIVVLGATGNIGGPIIDSLLAHPAGYSVTAITRDKSKASFPSAVQVIESDFSDDSLRSIFKDQDAIISSVPAPQLADQIRYIDIAISYGVVRFVPSEFGMDTQKPDAVKWRSPRMADKAKVLDYLKSHEDKLTWTAFITGGFFDWALRRPGGLGWDVPKGEVTIHDGGDVEWEATNVTRIGEAVAAALSPEYLDLSSNQIVYINSFTVTQNKMLAVLEKVTGKTFKVKQDTTQGMRDRAIEKLQMDPSDRAAAVEMATASVLGLGGINQYSKDREVWNEKLGLKEESLEETVRRALDERNW